MSHAAVVRQSTDATAFAVMVLLCFLWGVSQVAAKLPAPGISLVMQASIRSAVAALLLLLWAQARRIPLFESDRSFWPGLLAGSLFAGEFLFLFAGLAHTGASRMVVFVYLAPCLTALGLHWFVPSERLGFVQWLGVLLAFAGIVVAFGDGFISAPASLLGDTYCMVCSPRSSGR